MSNRLEYIHLDLIALSRDHITDLIDPEERIGYVDVTVAVLDDQDIGSNSGRCCCNIHIAVTQVGHDRHVRPLVARGTAQPVAVVLLPVATAFAAFATLRLSTPPPATSLLCLRLSMCWSAWLLLAIFVFRPD